MLERNRRVVDQYVERCVLYHIQYGQSLQSEYDSDLGGTVEFPVPNLTIEGNIKKYQSNDTLQICNQLHSSQTFDPYKIKKKPTINEAFSNILKWFKDL
jgi:hypothetical protein